MKECPACSRCFPDHVNHCPSDGGQLRFTIIGDTTLDGRYQLERRLGQGGMGMVFKARHIFLKTQHAIKIILPDLVGNDPSLATRFRQEAMAAAAIHHPNTIGVTDFGVINGTTPFLVMEFVEGYSLHELLQREGRMAPERALEIMLAVCSGVAAAHRQGIIHRDLKPLNILLKDGLAVGEGLKVLDFGLAKIKSGELLGSFVAAQTQGMMGSPFYMAPEQWSDEDVDRRSDLYSLGVILYQMLTGDVPFRGTSIPSIMKKHLTELPLPLASRGVHVPPAVEEAVRHALEKEADARPQSVEDFMEELRAALERVRAEAASAGVAAMQTLRFAPGETLEPPPELGAILTGARGTGATDHAPAAPPRPGGPHDAHATPADGGYSTVAEVPGAQAGAARPPSSAGEVARGPETGRQERAEQTALRPGDPGDVTRTAEAEGEEVTRVASVDAARRAAAERSRAEEEEKARAAAAEEERAREQGRRLAAAGAQRRAEEEEEARRLEAAEARQREAEEARRLEAAEEASRRRREQEEEEAERRRLAAEAKQKSEAAELREREAEESRKQEAEKQREREAEESRKREAAERAAAVSAAAESAALEERERREAERRSAAESARVAAQQASLQQSAAQPAAPQQSLAEHPGGAALDVRAAPAAAVTAAPARTRPRTTLIVLGVAAMLALLCGVVGLALFLKTRPAGGEAGPVTNAAADSDAGPANANASANRAAAPRQPDMVSLPGGTFRAGRADVPPISREYPPRYLLWVYNQWPAYSATVKPFAIDRTEVTSAEYAEFVRATGHAPPPGIWDGAGPRAGEENWPVRNVSSDDARAFAAWRSERDGVGYRLPTEEEWEYAARGGGDSPRLFPWGGEWAAGRANVESGALRPVGSFPSGRTPQGVEDMIGNVWEWTSSAAAMYKGNNRTALRGEDQGKLVARGGSCQSQMTGDEPITATSRGFIAKDVRDAVLGFRLVREGP